MLDKNAIKDWVTPYAQSVYLPYMPDHIMAILRSMLLWWSVQLLSHGVSPYLFPKTFAKMPTRTRISWDLHVVSLVHSLIIGPVMLYYFVNLNEQTDRLFGYDYTLGQMYAISLGYFLWDVIVSLRYEGITFIVHGFLGFCANINVYRPLLMFGGLPILMWELSTPFLNIHWFLDKCGLTGTVVQFVNALCLLLTYVIVRMTLGVYQSYVIISMVWSERATNLFIMLKLFYTVGLIMLNMFNYMWFFKMLRAMHKRFAPPASKKSQ